MAVWPSSKQSYYILSPVSTEMGDHLRAYRLAMQPATQADSPSHLQPDGKWQWQYHLASQWPHITDSAVYLPLGSLLYDREMTTSPTILYGTWYSLPF